MKNREPSVEPIQAPDEAGAPEVRVERGFTLVMALMVMALLTTLGLALLFTAETDRTISRNYFGTIQATYSAEAAVEAMTRALMMDFRLDEGENKGAWSNKWLVVCDLADPAECLTHYGFNPTLTSCYGGGTGCVVQDTTGSKAGVPNNWVADITWRPGAIPRPTFPSSEPVMLHRALGGVDPPTYTKGPLNWWQRFRVDPSNPANLYTNLDHGGKPNTLADIALTSVCLQNCANPQPGDFSSEQLVVTGIGQSPFRITAQLARTKNPATRSVSLKVQGELLGLWEHALVAGEGIPGQDSVVEGDYLIRGSVMSFTNILDKPTFVFGAPHTGIVNNYYDSDAGVPPIDGWWWQDARGCATDYCDSNNSTSAFDSDNNAGTFTVEPITHHLPEPNNGRDDQKRKTAGYLPLPDPRNADYQGPEGLDAKLRIEKGNNTPAGPSIIIGDALASLGQVESDETTTGQLPGRLWDNLADIFMNTNSELATEIQGVPVAGHKNNVYRRRWDLGSGGTNQKSGGWDLPRSGMPGALKFPEVDDPYVEPVTKVEYASYNQFIHATNDAVSPPAAPPGPGGWALDLTNLDGSQIGGLNKLPTMLGWYNGCLPGCNDPAAKCYPRGALGGAAPTQQPHPTNAELRATFGSAASPKRLREKYGCTAMYKVDVGFQGPANPYRRCGETNYVPDCSLGTPPIDGIKLESCIIEAICDPATGPCGAAGGTYTDPNDPSRLLQRCPSQIDIELFRRGFNDSRVYSDPGSAVNLDSSSSVDAPPQRARRTMTESFAYKIYMDILFLLEGSCNQAASDFYADNLGALPAEFKQSIPARFQATGTCDPNRPPCFHERSAYLDVHVQLPDLPYLDHYASPVPKVTYTKHGRWLSVRLRPAGAPGGPITVLADDRWGRGTDTYNMDSCQPAQPTYPNTDIADEVVEIEGAHNYAGMVRHKYNISPNAWTNWRTGLGHPARYDHGEIRHPDDLQWRNQPTGAFVLAFHLPCTDDPNSGNPYKCSGTATAPAISYPGFYTHLFGWAPKYTIWRTDQTDWTNAPHPAPAWTCASKPSGSPNTGCPTGPNVDWAWWAESLWVANVTTLWNDPTVIGAAPGTAYGGARVARGIKDMARDTTTSPIEARPLPTLASGLPQPSLLGFHIAMPVTRGTSTPPFRLGIDRRGDITYSEKCVGQVYQSCNLDSDGSRCNSNSKCGAAFAGSAGNCVTNPTTATTCQDEADFVAGGIETGLGYGGCTEVFSRLTRLRNTFLDPDPATGPAPLVSSYVDRIKRRTTPAGCVSPCVGADCIYRGVDPDDLGTWNQTVWNEAAVPQTPAFASYYTPVAGKIDRYGRGWPGWASVNVLMGAGMVVKTQETVLRPGFTLGNDRNITTVPQQYLGATPYANGQYNYQTLMTTKASPKDFCKDGWPLSPQYRPSCRGYPYPITPPDHPERRGFISDPIVYDGRLIFYASSRNGARDATTTKPRVQIYDHLVPRGELGCGDFLGLVSNGTTRIDMDMTYETGEPKKMLVAAFSLSQNYLRDKTPVDTELELAGSWIARAFDLQAHPSVNPIQFIGVPSIAGPPPGGSRCDHIYMPARERVVKRQDLSFGEVEALPPGY